MIRATDLLEYDSRVLYNKEAFLLNYEKDFRSFIRLSSELQSAWNRIAGERDSEGRSHVGLLLLSGLLIRHCTFGFQQLACYQSFLCWLSFRPGLEGLLIIGKWVDDPKAARVWREREANPQAYRKLYSGGGLVSRSLPKSQDFRTVLGRLNDGFVHPNPQFAWGATTLRDAGEKVEIGTQYFDTEPLLHEAHLLAFENLVDLIVISSIGLVNGLLGPPPTGTNPREAISETQRSRARSLAQKASAAKKIMEDLGLWQF